VRLAEACVLGIQALAEPDDGTCSAKTAKASIAKAGEGARVFAEGTAVATTPSRPEVGGGVALVGAMRAGDSEPKAERLRLDLRKWDGTRDDPGLQAVKRPGHDVAQGDFI
jgi:hypothetical protein